MVLQKRLDYGFLGYQVPTMPRGSRSARGRGSLKRKVDDQICAFEVLATVAGKLLQERESSPASSNASARGVQCTNIKDIVKQEQLEEEKPLKIEPCDQGSCDKCAIVSELGFKGHNQNYFSKEFPNAQNDTGSPASIIINSDPSKVGCVEDSVIEVGSPGCRESYKGKVEIGIGRQVEVEPQNISCLVNVSKPDMCSSEDPMELDTKPPALVSSDSSVEVPLCRNPIPHGPFPRCCDDVMVVSRDDDENSSGCTRPITLTSKDFRAPSHVEDRKVKKLWASRYWKVAPKLDGKLSKDGDTKPVFRNRKTCYKRKRSERNSPFKRRKLFKPTSVLTSDRGISNEGICSSPEKGINGNTIGSGGTTHGAIGPSSSVAGQESSFRSRDSHVKLSIKSFRVPELFIEIPETATVGSLKRAVMEAVTAILGGGPRVGVLLQGKKVRDDSKTLVQTGIFHDEKLDGLGFALEPNPTNAPPPLCPEDPPFLLPCDTNLPLTRHPTTLALDKGPSDNSPNSPITSSGNCVKSDHDLVPTLTDTSMEKITSDSKALVAIPAMSVEALAVVPLHQKSMRSELVQRRIRRPFSVSEVEALVQAVEKLGTGRWRDVKVRAFDNAKHRTYVDLKDKWKTLVHTARISPQQRRGEPVPQELLDRVLSAHAYWSQQQARQQAKQQAETCLLR